MAKLFGKRDKKHAGGRVPNARSPLPDPRDSFAISPLPRHAGPPASSTPLADQLARGGAGVTDDYVVLPRVLAEQMPLPWQREAASLLAQFQHTHRSLSWPRYRVLPSRAERLVDLDEEQLAEAGYVVEMDTGGELVYRERNGRKVTAPDKTTVLVTCLDPVQRAAGAEMPVEPGTVRERAAGPVPMNIGPEPKWNVVPNKAHTEPPPTFAPSETAAEVQEEAPRGAHAEVPADTFVSEEDTPPSGFPLPAAAAPAESPAAGPVDWFDEPEDLPSLPAIPNATGDEDVEAPESGPGFGPTGDPIERPYRYGESG